MRDAPGTYRDAGCGGLGSEGTNAARRKNDCDPAPDEVRSKLREARAVITRPAEFDSNVTSLDIACLAQALPKGLDPLNICFWHARMQESYGGSRLLLRAG